MSQVACFKFHVSSSMSQVSRFKFHVSSSMFQVPCSKCHASSFVFQVSCFKFHVSGSIRVKRCAEHLGLFAEYLKGGAEQLKKYAAPLLFNKFSVKHVSYLKNPRRASRADVA